MAEDRTGALDEALERLHCSGPEREGWLTNHAPMAVEALARHGHSGRIHRWVDRYEQKLEEPAPARAPIDGANWRQALGDPSRITDWVRHFEVQLSERPWREVLTRWWPRLLPGVTGASTHVVIRTGHAVRTLLDSERGEVTAPRVAELAQSLGYWAARCAPLPGVEALRSPRSAADALGLVSRVPDQSGGIRHRLPQIHALPAWPGSMEYEGAQIPERLAELVEAATHHYARNAHGQPVMLVHAATAPNAVLRTLPALPEHLWPQSLAAAWEASAVVVAAYAPATPLQPAETDTSVEEAFERAAQHGDEHAVKLADTALDVAAGPLTYAAISRACDLIDPMG